MGQRPDLTEVAIRTKDVPVHYAMKKALVRPILLGVRDTVTETGKVAVNGFGRFRIEVRKVSVGIGSRKKKDKVTVTFHPCKGFLKEVGDRWNQKLKIVISEPENVSFAPGKASEGSSVPEDGAQDATFSTRSTES